MTLGSYPKTSERRKKAEGREGETEKYTDFFVMVITAPQKEVWETLPGYLARYGFLGEEAKHRTITTGVWSTGVSDTRMWVLECIFSLALRRQTFKEICTKKSNYFLPPHQAQKCP